MIASPQRLTLACRKLIVAVEKKTWFRAVEPQFWQTALGTTQTKFFSTRYNPAQAAPMPFEVLYLAENPMVALFEVQAIFGDPTVPGSVISHPQKAYVVINVEVTLHQVVDLTAATAQTVLRTTAQELTGDWRGYQQRSQTTTIKQPVGMAPTQQLGACLFAVPDLEGFLTFSSRMPYHQTLTIP